MTVAKRSAQRLNRAFFRRDSVTVARALLGRELVRLDHRGERLCGVIVETEAYLGVEDKAAHAFGGRRTARNESMYAQAGTSYVYFTYGMHHCFNVVCGEKDEPVAVLLRALEPTQGIEKMTQRRQHRRRRTPVRPTDLCSGPAKLCQALEIDRSLDGVDLCANDQLFIEPSRSRHVAASEIIASPRIGVAYAQEWAVRPLRFHLANSPHVSRK